MRKDIKVSVSILCADFKYLADEVKKCEDSGADMLHVDVMDGHFVPVITVGKMIVEAIRPITKLPIEAHLMIENPYAHIDDFLNAGADIISVHAECYGQRRKGCRNFGEYPKEVDKIDIELARKDIKKVHDSGKEIIMTVNPGTPLCFDEILPEIDGVLIMSVNPGFAKQKFMPVALPKIQALSRTFKGYIAVDGGVNADTAQSVIDAGANVLATASYFFGAQDPSQAVKYFKSLMPQKHKKRA